MSYSVDIMSKECVIFRLKVRNLHWEVLLYY